MLRELFPAGSLVFHDTLHPGRGMPVAAYRPFLHAYATATQMGQNLESHGSGIYWKWIQAAPAQFRRSNAFGTMDRDQGWLHGPGVNASSSRDNQDLLTLLYNGRQQANMGDVVGYHAWYDHYLPALAHLKQVWLKHGEGAASFYDQYYLPAAQNVTRLMIGRSPMPIASRVSAGDSSATPASVRLSTFGDGHVPIRYTLDGSPPSSSSGKLYRSGDVLTIPAEGGLRATSETPELEVSRELRLVGGALKTDDAGPPSPWEPSFPALAPAFPPTWRLNASTIIHTGNISGWTETAAAAKYGIVSFDGNNARSVWKKTDGNDSICEATLLEQARRVKAAKTGTRVLVYRQAMLAISWMESCRAVMYDEAFSGYFLRYKSGAVWRQDGAACDNGNPDDPAGDCMIWNWTNASARRYFQDVVVGGPRGTGSELVDGIFLVSGLIALPPPLQRSNPWERFSLSQDDPGPGSLAQPMVEYIEWVHRAAAGIGMSPAELEALSQATFEMISELRTKLAAQGKIAWLNGQATSGPFQSISDSNCSSFAISLTCGWWKAPVPGPTCEQFYRTRCSQPSYGAVDLGVLTPTNETACHSMGCYQLSIASLLLLRQERAWVVTAAWQQTSNASVFAGRRGALIWTPDFDRDVGQPLGRCVESSPGRFEREWSSGTVSIDCSNLSVVLPGTVPVPPAPAPSPAPAPTPPPPSPNATWSGLRVSTKRYGRTSAAGQPGLLALQFGDDPTEVHPPLWLTLTLILPKHPGSLEEDTSMFDEQVRRAAEAGLRVVCICLTRDNYPAGSPPANSPWFSPSEPLDNHTRFLLDRVITLHPKVLFIIRFYAQQPDNAHDIVLRNLTDDGSVSLGNNISGTGPGMMNSLTKAWEASAVSKLKVMLRYLDSEYPSRIVGVFPTFLHTAEWFLPGYGYDFAPDVLVPDYSEATRQRYCAEVHPGNPGCALPLPSQRNRAAFGSGFADSATAQLNLFYSRTVVSAITALAEAAKEASSGKLLTIAYYGYHYELAGSRLPGSGHLALQQLLESPHLNGVASPYMYQSMVRNNSRGGPLMPHGPWDSATANGKFWVIEDDSRTALDVIPGNFADSQSGADSTNLMRRNALTAMWHGHGLYFYDLNNAGYFGQPLRPNVTAAIWSGVSSSIQAFNDEIRHQSSAVIRDLPTIDLEHDAEAHDAGGTSADWSVMVPEIAVFSDETSAAIRTMIPMEDLPMHSSPSYGAFDAMLLGDVLPVIASSGAAVRVFQLTDLLLPGLEWGHFRLCIFLNAFVVTPNISAAVKTKLQRPNTTLLWQYAPGLYSSATGQPDPACVSELVGIPLRRGAGGIDLLTRLVPSEAAHDPFNALARRGLQYGHRGCCEQWPKQVDPWFYWSNETLVGQSQHGHDDAVDVEVLGILEQANLSVPVGGLVRAKHRDTGHTTVFTAAPGLPVALWRSIAEEAGVHMYTADRANASQCTAENEETSLHELTDSVELHSSVLLYHAAPTCNGNAGSRRQVLLPARATVTDEKLFVVCSNCSEFRTPPMAAGEVLLFRVQAVVDSTKSGDRRAAAAAVLHLQQRISTTALKMDDNAKAKAVRRVCTVTEYNATGDGKTFDTAAIDAALHDCSGGGVVVLPGPNMFLTAGGHVLRSNMGLEIQAGAVLLQSPDPSKGSAANTSIPCGNAPVPHFAGFSAGCAILSAQNASNVSIYGAGVIRGAGAPGTCWNYAGGTPFANLLKFAYITGLSISGVSLQNPCGWTVHPQHCRDVAIQNITISCEPVQYHYNTDGIDPDSCVDVLIEDLDYSCGDDAVAIKASYPGCEPSRNITIRRLKSGGRGGLTIGSEVQGGAEDIVFEDSVSTGPSGIRISQQTQRGGFLKNIWFRNISFDFGDKYVTLKKKYFVLTLEQSYAAEDDGKVCPGNDPQPNMNGIHFENLTVVKAPSNLSIGDLSCDQTMPPACTNITFDGLVFLDVHEPLPLTCSSRPGTECKGNCSSVHGEVTGVSPADACRCMLSP